MIEAASQTLDRRLFLAASAATAGATAFGAVSDATAQEAGSLADCHVHLFNASDLPVGKFVQYVAIPSLAPGTPPWAAAMADLFMNVIKPLAVSVEREANPPFLSIGLEPSPMDFGKAVADYVRARTRPDGASPMDPALQESYRALTTLVAEDASVTVDLSPLNLPYALQAPSQRAASADLTADSFAAAARKAEDGGDGARDLGDLFVLKRLGDTAQTRDLLAAPLPNLPAMLSGGRKAVRMIGWGYLMCKARKTHLERYMRDYSIREARPRLIVNHMVDYDKWLDDGPSPASSHLAQLDLMYALARRRNNRPRLMTFAGYCPLKHALETVSGQPTTFDALKARYGRQVSGFKLYPPMGFRPMGNAELSDAQFRRPGGEADVVMRQWRDAGGQPGRLGLALDQALESFYAWCVSEDVPLMAHAGPGNEAFPGFGERANPLYWERVRQRYPTLRLSLGHLINTAQPFIKRVTPDVDVGDYDHSTDAYVWSMDAPPRLFSPLDGVASNIYGDLGYMPELIGRPSLAKAFFVALKQHFRQSDPGLRHVLFGSDWIMLGIEASDSDYVRSLRQGMIDAGYSAQERDNILWGNGRRFMRLAS